MTRVALVVALVVWSAAGVVYAARNFSVVRSEWLTSGQETSVTNAVTNLFGAGCNWGSVTIDKQLDPARGNTEHLRILTRCRHLGETSIDALPANAQVE